ncbi:hypothetical protein M430DRAFT_269479 [Amorphotheca resinae ATCC 22711]|uniref:Uncharacterized protein n=1 Tax=Amorphotheca resinae ATCC 22711 TaxID=857342 RepID=A0A2T3BFI6_AMORE|nr:hypothetical protein M430DRAFT_269479 [Amorphotheca resinae ATCC 22711]PSS28098.1 hypothetical protein M430DRAFT_269479 [Amorphotheca resinae ATCC 22711]
MTPRTLRSASTITFEGRRSSQNSGKGPCLCFVESCRIILRNKKRATKFPSVCFIIHCIIALSNEMMQMPFNECLEIISGD